MGLSDLAGTADFALAFAVVHEMPSVQIFFQETAAALKARGAVLLVEPAGHVKQADFEAELQSAAQAGLHVDHRPKVRQSHAALLIKT